MLVRPGSGRNFGGSESPRLAAHDDRVSEGLLLEAGHVLGDAPRDGVVPSYRRAAAGDLVCLRPDEPDTGCHTATGA